MEDITMKKKEYQKPTMELIEADLGQQILQGSVTSVKAKGLDPNEDFEYNDENAKGDSWKDAW